MDGNGRWARRRGLPVIAGHRAGHARAAAHGRGRDRPRRRLAGGVRVLDRELDAPGRRGARPARPARRDDPARVPGPRRAGRARALRRPARPLLADDRRRDAGRSRTTPRANEALDLYVCFDYGGRDELVEAARRLVRDGVAAEEIDEAALRERLDEPRLPDPDLVIRTSGEQPRLELPALADRLRRVRLLGRRSGPTSAVTSCASALAEYAAPPPALRGAMSDLARPACSSPRSRSSPRGRSARPGSAASRCCCSALVAAGSRLHEFFRMAPRAAADPADRLRRRRSRWWSRPTSRASRGRSRRCSATLLVDVPRRRRRSRSRESALVLARRHDVRRRLDRLRRRVPRAAARARRGADHFGFNLAARGADRHLGLGHLRLLRRPPPRPPPAGARDLAEQDRRGLRDRPRRSAPSPAG